MPDGARIEEIPHTGWREGGFVVVPPRRTDNHVWDTVWLSGSAFAGFGLLGAALAAGAKELCDAIGWSWPGSFWGTVGVILVLAAACAAAVVWAYVRRPDPARRWDETCARLALEDASLVLCAWAVEGADSSLLPREHTLWHSIWSADPAGMHLSRMWATDVSGKVLRKWEFAHAPEGLRHVPWPDRPTALWADMSKSMVLRASLPPMTAHARLALRARLSPSVQLPPAHTR